MDMARAGHGACGIDPGPFMAMEQAHLAAIGHMAGIPPIAHGRRRKKYFAAHAAAPWKPSLCPVPFWEEIENAKQKIIFFRRSLLGAGSATPPLGMFYGWWFSVIEGVLGSFGRALQTCAIGLH